MYGVYIVKCVCVVLCVVCVVWCVYGTVCDIVWYGVCGVYMCAMCGMACVYGMLYT